MRPSQWRTSLAVTTVACLLGAFLLPDSALADESVDGVPSIVDIRPRAVATTDFVTENDAVIVTASGFLPGEEVRLNIVSTPGGIEAIHDSRRARADGTASFPIGGSRGRPINNYAGSYQTEITSKQSMDEEYLSQSFSVLPVHHPDGTDTGAGTGGATTPAGGATTPGEGTGEGTSSMGGIGPRAKNGVQIGPGPGFSVVGVGLSLLTLTLTTAATVVVARKSQKSKADD